MVVCWRLHEAIKKFDAFRQPKQEALHEPTGLGIVITLTAVVICIGLFVVQLTAFVTAENQAHLQIDSDDSETVRLNFDVTMFDLACDYANIGVFDAFGTGRTNVTRNIVKQPLDHEGADKGHPYTEEELTELEFADRPQLSASEIAELDSDWVSVAGHVTNSDFRNALEAHDFVFVLFCIPGFGPCKILLQGWMRFANSTNRGEVQMHDADGNVADVHALQVNCAPTAFADMCKEQGVHQFPSIRLYPRTISDKPSFVVVNFGFPMPIIMASLAGVDVQVGPVPMQQMVEALTTVMRQTVKSRHLHQHVQHHAIFKEGCRLSGYIDVPRVPGTLHFEAKSSTDKMLNYAFTNVSHRVNHFSFGEPDAAWSEVPDRYGLGVRPLDGKSFDALHFHQGPHHYAKVVHTRMEIEGGLRLYMLTHSWNMQTFPMHEPPKAKFSFDLSPVEVVIVRGRRWYDFATSTLAIVGGAYSSLRFMYWLFAFFGDMDIRVNFLEFRKSVGLGFGGGNKVSATA